MTLKLSRCVLHRLDADEAEIVKTPNVVNSISNVDQPGHDTVSQETNKPKDAEGIQALFEPEKVNKDTEPAADKLAKEAKRVEIRKGRLGM